MIILGEVLQPYHVPAFICIILGVYLVSKAKRNIPNLIGKNLLLFLLFLNALNKNFLNY